MRQVGGGGHGGHGRAPAPGAQAAQAGAHHQWHPGALRSMALAGGKRLKKLLW